MKTTVKTCKSGIHDRVYEGKYLLTNPPQNNWICRRCGETGREVVSHAWNRIDEYEYLKKKFANL